MATHGASACARHQKTSAAPSPWTASRQSVALLSVGLAVGLFAVAPAYATGEADGEAGATASELGGAVGATTGLLDPLGRDLYFPFDALEDDGSPLLEAVGKADVVATVSSAHGGQVLAGPDRWSSGHSLRFERFRAGEPAAPAVVVVRPAAGADDATDPGSRPFSFGAEFSLDAESGVSPTDNGDNLVQRGLFGVGAQYKIELDRGHPTCRVSGSEGTLQVRASEPVEAEQWYRVRCRRAGDQVVLRVVTSTGGERDVREYAEEGRTGTLSYGAGDSPFSIGGKVDADGRVVSQASDQFNGLVDDVFFRSAG